MKQLFGERAAMLIRLFLKGLGWFLVFILPIATLGILLMPAYDWTHPREAAIGTLKEKNVEGLRWMVGFEVSEQRRNGEVIRSSQNRDFVVFPEVFWRATVYEYSEATDSAPKLKVRQGSAVVYLLIYALLIGFSWFVSRPKITGLIRQKRTRGAVSAH